MMAEFRNTIRLEVYTGTSWHSIMKHYSVDMSTGGLFLESDAILPVDTSLVIKFKLPGIETNILCNARVAWTNEPGNLKKSSLPPGMGVQFLDLSLEDPQNIRNFLK